jgi:hypothetical protein
VGEMRNALILVGNLNVGDSEDLGIDENNKMGL